MLAIVRNSHQQPPVEIRDLPEPTPAHNEALIEVHASSLNRGELDLLSVRDDGWRPGQDVAGVVVQAARDGSGPPSGTRVVGLIEGGAWGQLVAAPTARLAPLPDEVDFGTAATLPLAGLTALRTVRLAGPVLGRELLVTGAGGGVGHLTVQLAVRAGAFVTAQAADERHHELTAQGATAVVERLQDAEQQFDVILDGLGGAALKQAVALIKPGGTIVLYGAVIPEPAELTILDFIGHENAIIRSFLSYASGDEASIGSDLRVLARLVAAEALRPAIGLELPLERAPELIAAFAAGNVRGKAVLTVRNQAAPADHTGNDPETAGRSQHWATP
jgi:NADPH2:quinone reductase